MTVPRRHVLRWAALPLALPLAGCASYYYGGGGLPDLLKTDPLEANYRAADQLLQTARIDPALPLVVATLVSVDRMHESSRLGRLFSEQVASRLVQRGLNVVEPTLRETLALQRDQGVLLLSRELREVARSHAAQAVVVGTYAASATTLYVNLKMVVPTGNSVVAASDYALPLDDNLRTLLLAR